MDTSPQSLKTPSKIALAALGVLLIGAIVFFKERLLFIDTSYYAFNIINYKGLALIHQRYGAFISQIIPYAGFKLHLPIGAILFGYAISFNVFFVVIGALLIYRYKQYRLAILIALFNFLIVGNSYFLACAEIFTAVAWMLLFFAATIYLGKKQVNILLLIIPFLVLGFLTISTHFQVIIPMLFLWVYFIIEKKHWPFSLSKTILLSGLLIVILLFRLVITKPDAYDSSHLHGIQHFSFWDVRHAFSTPVIRMFFYRCIVNYWLAIVVFIIGMVSLLKNGEKKLAAWSFISCAGYLIIMALVYKDIDRDPTSIHIDTEWACLGIIIATPFVFSFLPTQKTSIAVGMLSIIFIVKLAYIGAALPVFSWRVHFEESVLVQMKKKGITKLALYREPGISSKMILDWAVTYESLFLSAMNGDKPQPTFFIINQEDKETQAAIKNPKCYYNAFDIMPADRLNSTYFAIDTAQPYQIMSYGELFK
jgi:hypothetical protein